MPARFVNFRVVKRPVDGIQNAGYESVEWNSTGTASGVYFSRLAAGSFVETREMALIR